MAADESRLSIDLFCRVVDNYGDIGVCWRLARQLAQQGPVRLIVDDYAVFRKIEPRLDENAALQTIDNVILLRWDEGILLQHYGSPAHAVIEAFACDLPGSVIAKMQQKPSTVWIDLEYLSAEDWVETHHAVPSVHPTTGLQKTLFFPGFSEKTGGLFREENLLAQRIRFAADTAAQNGWRQGAGLPPKQQGVLDVSMFCYPDAPVDDLLSDWARGDGKIRLLVPDGIAAAKPGTLPRQEGNLTVQPIPFLTQPDYDRLLWSCDLNFVRGEDSWLRAIWAAKPFIWQAYPQEKGASQVKLKAFLARYTEGLAQSDAESLADFHAMWNLGGREGKSGPQDWRNLLSALPVLTAHARAWTDRQGRQEDCATRLTRFIRSQYANQITKVTG